jgi:uncharacterized protein
MTGSKRNLSAVVDSNIFVSGLIAEKGLPHRLIKLLEEELFILIISEDLREELEEVLNREKFSAFLSESKLSKFFRMIDVISTFVLPLTDTPVEIRDPKDQKVLNAALAGNADYLVTGDEDLLALRDEKELEDLKIISLKEFLKLFR